MTNLVYEVEVGTGIKVDGLMIDGTVWILNGKLHREDGPAVEECCGTLRWYIGGKRHREDGPAVKYPDGMQAWFIDGKRHREDGPAIEYAHGAKTWYLDDVDYSKKGWKKELKRRNKPLRLTVAEISDRLGIDNLEIIAG